MRFSYWWDDWAPPVIILAVCAALMTTILVAGNWASKTGCAARWEDSGYESRYSFRGGCRVKIDGKWLPENAVRQIEQAVSL